MESTRRALALMEHMHYSNYGTTQISVTFRNETPCLQDFALLLLKAFLLGLLTEKLKQHLPSSGLY